MPLTEEQKSNPRRKLTRRDLRRQARRATKTKHLKYTKTIDDSKKVVPSSKSKREDLLLLKKKKKRIRNKETQLLKERKSDTQSEFERFNRDVATERRKQHGDLIEEEDKEIRKYEKSLRLNKRKSKGVPLSFQRDGLSYLWEVCESEYRQKQPVESDDDDNNEFDGLNTDIFDLSDDAGDDGEIEAAPEIEETDVPTAKKGLLKKRVVDSDALGSSAKRVRFSGDKVEPETELTTEDIYGRTVDSMGHLVQKGNEQNAQLKLMELESNNPNRAEEKLNLQKQLRSLINRLSESNAFTILGQIQQLYTSASRNDVKQILSELMIRALFSRDLMPDRFILEHCFLFALIHNKLSTDITAYFLEKSALEFDRMYNELHLSSTSSNDMMSTKCCTNAVRMFAHFYNFKIIHADLISDIFKKLVGKFSEHDLELLLVLFSNAGFQFRKDHPLTLKELIYTIQTKVSSEDGQQMRDQSRVRFMLDTLAAVKNNNVMKITSFDISMIEHFVKLLRGLVKGTLESPLRISYDDLLHASERGRWWVVGSAWSGHHGQDGQNKDSTVTDTEVATDTPKSEFSTKLLELAKKQRMNTDLRKTVFCVLMSSEDYLNAFERLLKLGLNVQQEREIIHICVQCALKEKLYNPFYSFVIEQFCKYQKRFPLTTQFAVWDKLKEISSLPVKERKNLANLIGQLIKSQALSLTVLKVLDFGALDKITSAVMKKCFSSILETADDDALKMMFKKLVSNSQTRFVADGISVFLHKVLLNSEKAEIDGKLKAKIKLIDTVVFSQE